MIVTGPELSIITEQSLNSHAFSINAIKEIHAIKPLVCCFVEYLSTAITGINS